MSLMRFSISTCSAVRCPGHGGIHRRLPCFWRWLQDKAVLCITYGVHMFDVTPSLSIGLRLVFRERYYSCGSWGLSQRGAVFLVPSCFLSECWVGWLWLIGVSSARQSMSNNRAEVCSEGQRERTTTAMQGPLLKFTWQG